MARRALTAVLTAGLSATAIVFSFLGCYGDAERVGQCEDDNNPCTIDSCTSGATVHSSAPDGQECSLGDNAGKCAAMENGPARCVLTCESNPAECKCKDDSGCPGAEDCATWSCSDGQCLRTPANEGMPIAAQTKYDCQQVVCAAGELKSNDDMNDVPPDTAKGDCQKPACSMGNVTTMDDNDDKPMSMECIDMGCMNGGVTMSNSATGTPCNAGACNMAGTCADCLSLSDFTACKVLNGGTCPVKMCNGESSTDKANCKSGNSSDGVCCDTACTEVCKSCSVMGMKGTCSDIPYYQVDPSYVPTGGGMPVSCDPATAGAVCDGKGKCLKTVGSGCLTGPQCISGMCSAIMTCLGAKGEICLIGTDCVSTVCSAGKCT